jgi:glutamyl/glutaminyl-tRNA synthetase
MEWDKFWSANKKFLEERAYRYMGVTEANKVPFVVTNAPVIPEVHTAPLHPQKPELGTRPMRRGRDLLIEHDDAEMCVEGVEITFLRWGNMIVDKIHKDAQSGRVSRVEGRFNKDSTSFSKTKKVSWLADSGDGSVVRCKIVELGHLITKAKLEPDEDFKQYVNKNSLLEIPALVDPCIRLVREGEVLQLERKGFYRVDKQYSPTQEPVLIAIPDGKSGKR